MKTDITVVLDRSGSMQMVAEDTVGGFNQFVRDQKEVPGSCNLSLVQFDTVYEVVHRGVPIGLVPNLDFHPRGCTALLDAMGRAIQETGDRLRDMSQKPDKVVFVILTDGEENASKEFTRARINDMISHQRDVYKWEFVFLGANQDAIKEARSFGISADTAVNYASTSKGTQAAFCTMSANMSSLRTGQKTNMSYSDEQRKEVMDEDEPKKGFGGPWGK